MAPADVSAGPSRSTEFRGAIYHRSSGMLVRSGQDYCDGVALKNAGRKRRHMQIILIKSRRSASRKRAIDDGEET